MPVAEAYDHIIGLGYDCRLAYNLRATFGFELAQPFDWWVTPIAGLLSFLGNHSIDELYAPDCLRPVPSPGEDSIMTIENVRHGIWLFHDFPRKPKTNTVVDDWRDHIAAARDRTRFLVNRMLSVSSSERTLFVRASNKTERRELGGRYAALAQGIEPALRGLFSDHDFDLLFIDPPCDIQGPNISSLVIGDTTKKPWYGDLELWSKRLLGAGIRWTGHAAGAHINPDPTVGGDGLIPT